MAKKEVFYVGYPFYACTRCGESFTSEYMIADRLTGLWLFRPSRLDELPYPSRLNHDCEDAIGSAKPGDIYVIGIAELEGLVEVRPVTIDRWGRAVAPESGQQIPYILEEGPSESLLGIDL